MKRILIFIIALAATNCGHAAEVAMPQPVQGALRTYCYGCHNDKKTKGDINLKHDSDLRMIANNRKVWITALKEVKDGHMPPEKAKQPSSDERKLLVEFIDRTVNTLDCAQQKDPGRPSVRRLPVLHKRA